MLIYLSIRLEYMDLSNLVSNLFTVIVDYIITTLDWLRRSRLYGEHLQSMCINMIYECITQKCDLNWLLRKCSVMSTIMTLPSCCLFHSAITLTFVIFMCLQSWGGKENGFGLAECCQDLPVESYPSSATTVHFEFYTNRASKVSLFIMLNWFYLCQSITDLAQLLGT